MGKRCTILGILLTMLLFSANAQTCPFKVRLEVIPASCYNNGMVAYAMTNSSGEVITSAGSFTEVRAYYIEQGDTTKHYSGRYLVDASGNMNYSTGWDTLTVDYGTYTVGVEALCWDGATFVKKDTQTVLTIPTTYVKPSASSLYVTANTLDGFGRRPTLECKNTGRVQLKIENGKFPYYVTVVRHGTTDTLRTDTITGRQYSGTNETHYDYKDYYSFDSLPKGDWDFYVVDGCSYGLPRTGQTVEVVDYPLLDYVEVYASSGNMHDSNVVKINAVLDKDYSYYATALPDIAQYRFVYEGETPGEWKPFPLILNGFRAMLTDTVTSADKYCDIWNKKITLEYKRSQCRDTTVSRSFHLFKPNDAYFVRDSSDIYDSIDDVEHHCDDLYWWHRWYHEISYIYNSPSTVTKNEDHTYYRHHYTHPLTWIYYDTEREDTIKMDVVNNIASESRLYDTEVTAIYGDFHSYTYSNPLMLPIQRTLVDAHGCVIYTRFDSLPYCYDHGPQISDWEMFHTDGDHCCSTKGSVGVREHYHSEVDPDGTTIVLERSPYDNRYNFTAVYSSASQSWTVSRNNFENVATIHGGSDGLSMTLSDYCLPSGPYRFKVMTPCDTFVLSAKLSFPDIYSTTMVEEPLFTKSQQCTDSYITYTQGKFARERRNTSVETGLPLPVVTDDLTTSFQIISGPTGGYDGSLHYLNESIRISMPGDFIVRVSPTTSLYLCDSPIYYDTIHYGGPTVEFVYAYAYLCDSTSTQGTAYVKGTNGTPPYTYTLFDTADLQGNVIETIVMSDTTQPAIFSDKAMDSQHELSCLIKDACDAYFHINFYPRTMADLQKIWFDNGLTVMETCEGSTISAHALEIASILKYEWYNPSNELIDSVSSPSIFIPRGAADGWYKVIIRNTGCTDSIVDSVRLTVKEAPTISLTQTMTICPGEEAHLSFTPTSPTGEPLTFTVAFENGNGIETRTYSTASGMAQDDEYITYTNTKIYPLSVDDGNCDYTIADEHDTIYIYMKTNIVDICTLLGSRDTVCYGSDAQFLAKSTMDPPYTIRWYTDYELTNLIKTDVVTDASTWSYYDTLALTHHAEVFVAIEKEGFCPTVYGLPTNSVNFASGSTEIACGQVIRVYDDGGATGDYATGTNTKHTYTTTDGKPVTIHFEELNLSETAHLFVINGTALNVDSVLYDLTAGSPNPGVISSNGNALTLFFMPGMKPDAGWNAIVEHSPGMSIADVYKKNEVVLRDEVCQSQTNTYDDPYHVVPNVVPDLTTLTKNLRKAGTYSYTKTIPGADVHGCDSTVTFILTVNPPPHHDTTVVTTNFILDETGGYVWPTDGRVYTKSGRYSKRTATYGGCDSLDILDFIVLEVDTSDNEICRDDTTRLFVSVKAPDMSFRDELIPPTIRIGDVLCNDGSIMNVDSFLVKDPTAKSAKGVVFYVDQTGAHGKAVALKKAFNQQIVWSYDPNQIIRSLTITSTITQAVLDNNGEGNTLNMLNTALTYPDATEDDLVTYVPPAYYCYYYDHNTLTTGTVHLGWYLPAVGEMQLLYNSRGPVNTTLTKLRSKYSAIEVLSVGYTEGMWTSTQANIYTYNYSETRKYRGHAWFIEYDGGLVQNGNVSSGARDNEINFPRAIIKF